MCLCNSLSMGLGQDKQQHTAVHTKGDNRGESMAVAVGVSEM